MNTNDYNLSVPGDAWVSPLLSWYRENRRTLPWRNTGNPLDVWISEIMLQQTRVEAVKRYFVRFRSALPDAASIAGCPEDRLMKLWEGLGYYSRARNIQKCAQVLVRDFGGKLPADHETLLKLPGIGPYTAGAIASIAFGIPVSAVDGNVLRVYARLTGCTDDIALPATKKRFAEELDTLIRTCRENAADAGIASPLPPAGAGPSVTDSAGAAPFSVSEFNQALMELGALVCVPNGPPLCASCPLRELCAAAREGLTETIPVKSGKKPRKIENRTILIVRDGDSFYLRKRPEKGLLAGLYEFPGVPGHLGSEEALQAAAALGFEPLRIAPLPDGKHVFTHVEWHMKAWEIRTAGFPLKGDAADAGQFSAFTAVRDLSRFAVPSAFRTWVDWYALRCPASETDK